MITYLSFSKEFEHYFPTTEDPQGGKNGPMTHLWTGQLNQLCPCYKKINYLRLQMIVALRVCLIQLQISIRSRLKSRWNILRFLQKYRKACFHFQHPIFVKQGFLTATKTRQWGRLDKGTHSGCPCHSHCPEMGPSVWFCTVMSCVIISLHITV